MRRYLVTSEQRLATLTEVLRVVALIWDEHEVRALLRYVLREVTHEQMVRLADAVELVEALQQFESGMPHRGIQ